MPTESRWALPPELVEGPTIAQLVFQDLFQLDRRFENRLYMR
jgi:hypothetical protein